MKKQSLLLVLTLVLVASPINSCSHQSPLSRISKQQYNNIQYDNYSNSLWASYAEEDTLHVLTRVSGSEDFNFEQSQKIDTPENKQILSFCIIENLVWIAVTDKPVAQSGAIYIYDKSNQALSKFLDFNVSDCKVLQDKSIVFWGEGKVLLIDQDKKFTETEVPGIVFDVNQDSDGNTWITNEEGRIYREDKNNLELILEEERETKLFFDTKNNFWVINEKHILLYQNGNLSSQKLLRTDIQDVLYGAFEDNQQRVCLLFRKNILRYEDGILIEINTPKDAWNFRFGGVNWNSSLAFVGSNQGVYSIDLTSK